MRKDGAVGKENTDWNYQPISNQDECETKCTQQSQCTAYQYQRPQTGKTDQSTCKLWIGQVKGSEKEESGEGRCYIKDEDEKKRLQT